jgi:hypothetical protein
MRCFVFCKIILPHTTAIQLGAVCQLFELFLQILDDECWIHQIVNNLMESLKLTYYALNIIIVFIQ